MSATYEFRYANRPLPKGVRNPSPTGGRFLALKKKGGSFNGVKVER